MRVQCLACGKEHNNLHVNNTHLPKGDVGHGDFNYKAACYNCGSVGKLRQVKAPVAAIEVAALTEVQQLRLEANTKAAQEAADKQAIADKQEADDAKALFEGK
jgi:hypothetical protein